MNNIDYFYDMVGRLAKPLGRDMGIIHAALGVTSEAGEMADAVKANIVYGKPEDRVNVLEEAGDLIFFTQLMLSQYGLNLEDAIKANIAKLDTVRYSEGYSDAEALGRHKDMERDAMAMAVFGVPADEVGPTPLTQDGQVA